MLCLLLGTNATVASAAIVEPVGTASPTQTATLTFTASGTLGSIAVLTQGAPNLDFNYVAGGTCTTGTTYATGQTCTVSYTFTPTHPGPRYGGITLISTAGTLLADTYIFGTGTGPQLVYTPGIQNAIAPNSSYPFGLAVDGAGNLFVANNGGNLGVQRVLAAGGYITTFATGSGIIGPQGIAVDGSGNVFVADSSGGAVKEILAVGGATISIGSGFAFPYGIAVDGSGNLFVADSGTNSVKELFATGGYTTAISIGGSNFYKPTGIALDGNGNVFVANNGAVKEILAAGGYTTVNTLGQAKGSCSPAGISPEPTGVAVDAAGNLFVADLNCTGINELLAASAYNTVVSLGSGLFGPQGVAVDGTGNLFVASQGSPHIVKLDVSTPPTLNFATTAVGSTSTDSPKSVNVSNNGNGVLNVIPANSSITPGFTLGSTSTCPLVGTSPSLAAGTTCTFTISFSPIAPGLDAGKLTVADNNLNAASATQSILLNGTGTGTGAILPPSISAISPSSGTTTGGTSVTLTGTNLTGATALSFGSIAATSFSVNSDTSITATSPPGVGRVDVTVTTPGGTSPTSSADLFTYIPPLTQTITFPAPIGPAYAGTAVTLTAAASSALPVTFKVISGPATVTGSTLAYTGVGTVIVEADQPGNSTYGAAPPVQQTILTSLLAESVSITSVPVTTVVVIASTGTLQTFGAFAQGKPNADYAIVPGGTCAPGTTYAAGQTCTVEFTFHPMFPGLRFGGLTLTASPASGGGLMANSYVYGFGTGPQVLYSPGTQSLVGTALGSPSGVAIDGNGNLFVSNYTGIGMGLEEITPGGAVAILGTFDQGDDVTVDGSGNVFLAYSRTTVSELLAVNGTLPPNPVVRTITSSFDAINGISVDGNGNIFVANASTSATDAAIYEIVAVNGTIPASPTILTLASFPAIGGPTGVAVDGNGNVFISDELNAAVLEILAVNGVIPASPTIRTLATGFGEPTNIRTDDRGDVYISDHTNRAVYELVAVNGSVPASPTVLTLGTGLSTPDGLCVNGDGNLFIADSGIAQIVELDFADAPSLTFAPTLLGQTSADSPKTVTLTNGGNTDLTFSIPPSGINPSITPGFTLNSASTCPLLSPASPLATLVVGASCTDAISFTPTLAGQYSGKLITTDNDLNIANATQTILLNGVGTTLAPTIVFNVPNKFYGTPPFAVNATSNSAGAFTYSVVSGPATISGNIVTLTGIGPVVLQVVQAASGYYTAGSQTTSFTVSKQQQTINFLAPATPVAFGVPPVTLSATATSGLPVVFSVLQGPATVSGNILTLTGVGNVIVAADQPGNAFYDPALEVTHSIVVYSAAVNIQLTGTPNPVFLKDPITFTATVSSNFALPTGTMLFLDGSNPLGSAPLVNGVAVFTTSSLTLGLHTITAVYSGDATFISLTSPALTVLVEDFSFVITNPDVIIAHGGNATYNFIVTTVGGTNMAATISFSIAGSPDHSTIVFTPATVATGSGTTTGTLTIQTPDYPVGPWSRLNGTHEPSNITFAALAFAGFLALGRKRRLFSRRATQLATLLLVLAASLSLTACAGGWGTQHYPMTVTATSGALSHSVTTKLTSQ